MTRMTASLLLCICIVGCAPATQPTGDAAPDQAASDSSAEADTGVRTDVASAAEAGPAEAPTLLSVQLVVHGTMQVRWSNPFTPCDAIVVERSANGGAYTMATTVTGAATSVRDMPGHANGTYCYHVLCERGADRSPPSNELCAMQ